MLLQPITVPFSKSTLKPSVYTLIGIVPLAPSEDRRHGTSLQGKQV